MKLEGKIQVFKPECICEKWLYSGREGILWKTFLTMFQEYTNSYKKTLWYIKKNENAHRFQLRFQSWEKSLLNENMCGVGTERNSEFD